MRRILVVAVLCACALAGAAQDPMTGLPRFGSIQSGGFDNINRQNLNAQFSIPIVSTSGRGLPFTMVLSYNSLIWIKKITNTWAPVVDPNGSPTWGWLRQTPVGTPKYTSNRFRCIANDGSNQWSIEYNNYTYLDSAGTRHAFSIDFTLAELPSLYPECGDGNPQTGYSNDGSGFYIDASSATSPKAFAPAGTYVQLSGPTKDANGNYISSSTAGNETDWYDTLGRLALKVINVTSPTNQTLYEYRDSNGTWQTIKVNLSSFNIKTNFGCSGVVEYSANGALLPTSVVLPDNTTQYTISYEDTPGYSGYKTGRIQQITLPQGGYYQYTYGSTNDGVSCTDGTVVSLTRVVNDGSTSATWSYSRAHGTNWVTTVTAPQLSYDAAANQSTYTFDSSGDETQEQIYQGSTGGTLKKSVSTTWTSGLPTEVDTTLGSLTSKVTYSYDSYGNVLSASEYDWGAGTPTRTTTYTYKSDTAYINAKLLSLMTQKVVHSGSGTGTAVYRMDVTYDGSTPTCVTGVAHHDDASFGCSYNTRGNATSTTVYLDPVNGAGGKTTTLTYNTVGNLLSVTDPASRTTSYTYGDSWYDANCSVSSTKAYVTVVTNAKSQTTSTQYNTCTGTPHSVTDANSQTSTYAYNSGTGYFGRLSSVTDPTSAATTYTYSGWTQAETALTFNSNSSTVDTLSVLDALARPMLTQRKQSPGASTYDTVETDHDVIGRVSRTTLPFSAAAGGTSSTAPAVATQYDALGRPTKVSDAGGGETDYTYSSNDDYVEVKPAPTGENTKRRQMEYDGLGRLKSVCEITSGTGSGTCSQTNSQTGYWTQYTYDVMDRLTGVTQNAQGSSQSRSYAYDALGRTTSETNPESGTISYTYDSDATCGSYAMDMVKRTDAVGNVTCYAYDELHRVTAITYPSGSYASVTAEKHFVYDSATVDGTAMANAVGRLARAYTGSGATTDLGFSYTARGEVSDVYESTPNSGGFYHATESYWASGAPYQLYGISGLPTITYGADGEGRANTVSAGSGQNPVTSVTYNTASLPTAVTFGSSDADSFSFDGNTNRMTQYQHTVNGSSLTGTLTWNANGSLGSMSITDALNSTNSQTCSYTHDDLGRIASVSCGTTWAQTFGFDPFGNISKSGSISFAGTYNTSTNRLTNMSSSYDSNGNMTGISSDATYSYSWDAEGKPVAITRSGATVNLTYDALGRMVEQNRSGSYTEIVYGPGGGKLALMSGTSLSNAFVPLPGGAQAVYNGSGLAYYRHSDWLGTSRLASAPSRTVYYDGAYAPYGESYSETGTTDRDFTAQNQDTTTGLYDFLYREYHPVSGRWNSPDPAGMAAADLANPQSLNLYAYVMNRPTAALDPSGLFMLAPTDTLPRTWLQDYFDNLSAQTTWDGDLTGSGYGSLGQWEVSQALATYIAGVDKAIQEVRQKWQEISLFKKGFYDFAGQMFNTCVEDRFGNDAAGVPQQTLKNAPRLDVRFNSVQLSAMAGTGALGWNQPNQGRFGTVYIASNYFYRNTSDALTWDYAAFAHELGNILDERLNPHSKSYGRTYGDPTSGYDTDTGAAVERCMFGYNPTSKQ